MVAEQPRVRWLDGSYGERDPETFRAPEFYGKRPLLEVIGRRTVLISGRGRRSVRRAGSFALSADASFRGMFPSGELPEDDPDLRLELEGRFELSLETRRGTVLMDGSHSDPADGDWQRDIRAAIAYATHLASAPSLRHHIGTRRVLTVAEAMNRR